VVFFLFRFRRKPRPQWDWQLYWETKAAYEWQLSHGRPYVGKLVDWNNRPQGEHASGKWFEY